MGSVVGVAAGLERADAGSVLAPFMFPEALVVAVDVFPVCVHEGEEVGLACGVEDGGDVGVRSVCVAVGVEGSVAMVRPGFYLSGAASW